MDKKYAFLSRLSARNIILSSFISEEDDKELETPDELYIMADEKWISTQFKISGTKHKKNDHDKKVMTKSIVIFDGYNTVGKRRYLNNKKVFASYDKNIINESLDYINNIYDVNKIFIIGDGAKWIKTLPSYYKFTSKTEVYYCLDKFHFKQALHHLAMNSNYEKYLLNYILNDNKEAFNKLVNFIKEDNLKREDIINKKMNI